MATSQCYIHVNSTAVDVAGYVPTHIIFFTMSVPAHRKSYSRVRRGRSHDELKATNLNVCVSCNAPVKPHYACKKCGAYAGRKVK